MRAIASTGGISRRRLLALALVACLGVALSAGLFWVIREQLLQQRDARLRLNAEEHAATVQTAIGRNVEVVESVEGLFAASISVERHEFRAFVRSVLARHSDIQALEWVPRVSRAELAAYEQAARKDGLTDFRVTERQAQGAMVPAAMRAEYFPVYYIEPLKGNEIAVGFDFASDPVRLEVLHRSRDAGETVITGRIVLVQETGEQFGFLICRPVYRKRVPLDTVVARRAALEGFALGVFRAGDMLEAALKGTSPAGLDIMLVDESAPPGERRLHFHPSRTRVTPVSSPTEAEIAGAYVRIQLTVPGRRWALLFVPAPTFLAQYPLTHAWIILGTGLLFTAALGLYLFTQFRGAVRIEKLATDLSALNAMLRENEEKLRHSLAEKDRLVQRLNDLATHDGLTGLYNHRTFHKLLEDELARAKRFGRPLSLLMLDVDLFKRVNDAHGHLAGDALLKGLSDLLVKQARAIDRVCRYGGEEFTVILPETGADGATGIAERLRAAVEERLFDIGNGRAAGVTVSVGVVTYPVHADLPDKLIDAADNALYAAKQAGRNRVARYAPMPA